MTTLYRILSSCAALALLSTPLAAARRCEQAKALAKIGQPAEALAAAREALSTVKAGSCADQVRTALCQAKAAGRAAGTVPAASRAEPAVQYSKESGIEIPKKISGESPRFGNALTRLGGGPVKIRVAAILDEEGCMEDATLQEGVGDPLDGIAVDAIRQWVFRPALREGKPLAVVYELIVTAYTH